MERYRTMEVKALLRELDDLIGWTEEEGTSREMLGYMQEILRMRTERPFGPLLEQVTNILEAGREITTEDITRVEQNFKPIARLLGGPYALEEIEPDELRLELDMFMTQVYARAQDGDHFDYYTMEELYEFGQHVYERIVGKPWIPEDHEEVIDMSGAHDE